VSGLTPQEAAGLTRLAFLLGRDLQRPARMLGGPRALWGASGADLAAALRVAGADAVTVRGVRARVDGREALSLVRAQGLRVLPLGGDGYPARLAQVYDPPFALLASGAIDDLTGALAERPVIAVVGSRRATAPARAFARGLAAGLAERGAVIISGLARGIDAEAHQGALEADGLTVAVLGCGAASAYPRANRDLRARIERHGAVASEYWPQTPPAPWRFPARNRIVSGLAHAVVVVEAAGRSGALITAGLFLVGESALSAYLSTTERFSVFGAFQFFVVLIVWMYYSSLVVLWGAELTRLLVLRFEERRGGVVSADVST